MDDTLAQRWNSVVRPRDVVYHCGDVGDLSILKRLNGRIYLIRGNKDSLPLKVYLRYFEDIHSMYIVDSMILTHIPVYKTQNTANIHGHLHSRNIADPYYINVCVDQCAYTPINMEAFRR